MTPGPAGTQTFVLVHGAWHGGWCYRDVARILRAQGHEVFAPTLTGLGERSHLGGGAVNLDTHIEDVTNVFLWEDLTDVVLVGHSYGGMVITGVADRIPDRIARLVYLDAFVPRHDGDSLNSLFPPTGAGMVEAAAGDGLTVPPPPPEAFGVAPDRRAWVAAKCVAQPFSTMLQGLRLTGRHREVGRRRYVLATGWGTPENPPPFVGIRDRLAADPAWDVRTLHAGHDVMVDDPQGTAALIAEAP
jgi:pimeloyl-ACP methyl ester carboxylesterase